MALAYETTEFGQCDRRVSLKWRTGPGGGGKGLFLVLTGFYLRLVFFLNAWPYRPHERNSDLQLEGSCKRTATNVEDGRTDGW